MLAYRLGYVFQFVLFAPDLVEEFQISVRMRRAIEPIDNV